MGLKCLKEGRFVGEGGRRSLDPDLDRGELGEDGGGPSSRITIEETEGNLNLQLKGREGRVDRPGQQQERTLSATRGMKDCPRMEATVVTVRRANFARNKCSSGLAAATAVKTIEEARRRGWGMWVPGEVSVAFRIVARDVDLLLGVEGVLKSRAVEDFVSHGDGGRKGSMLTQSRGPLSEDKKLGKRGGGDKGMWIAVARRAASKRNGPKANSFDGISIARCRIPTHPECTAQHLGFSYEDRCPMKLLLNPEDGGKEPGAKRAFLVRDTGVTTR
ncbi:predicted protein [Postia placenta Mad-698-R]|uniref:Uncharacterized protein n=1 Tax=Postia placenta MAD-698-R-SB12 TaxID=670580 RepID=A0A1X6NBH9_9APHY|nr:hypothetical protein POSPLADRAFT_1130960 [Postia placenta MAD-698-R-SB12]EED78254.1 predicted protein [Postia placenta Mad-698-R]OSX65880.1 hypothetical protein POSPLADRAFT_1130960 [Postia placenta MAD-698-R-SB12]